MPIKDLNRLIPEFKDKIEQLILRFKNDNINPDIELVVVETYRSQKDQDELYAQGRTKPGRKVTGTRHSEHIKGKAVDFAIKYQGRISWDTKITAVLNGYKLIGKLSDELGLKWGGHFEDPDMPHVQYS